MLKSLKMRLFGFLQKPQRGTLAPQLASYDLYDFQILNRLGIRPDRAYLLRRRMKSLGLDPERISQQESEKFQKLESVCNTCAERQVCALEFVKVEFNRGPDLADASADGWEEYCPNARELKLLEVIKSYERQLMINPTAHAKGQEDFSRQ